MELSALRRFVALSTAVLASCNTNPGTMVRVLVMPPSATLAPGEVKVFQAAVTGAADIRVTWSVREGSACGTIDSGGSYVAPSSPMKCHVVAASVADATRSTAAPVDVVAGAIPWRPFSAVSAWNTAIDPSPAIAPDSAALVADFASSSPYGAHLDVNISGYSVPLYWADASTPVFDVAAGLGGDGWVGSNGSNAIGSMPIPDGATPDTQSDHHMLVIDRDRSLEWGCWNMVPGATGQWNAGVCATSDLSGTGVRPPITTAQPWYRSVGARACGFPLSAGLIRVDEIAAGRIDHALVIAYPHIRTGWFTPPASTGQGRVGNDAISTRGIPCGGRMQFDPTVDLDALSLSAAGKAIVRALQEHGAYVGDYSGALSLYAENSPAAQASWAKGVLGTYELRDKIDLSRFRVLQLGALYDNGNGN